MQHAIGNTLSKRFVLAALCALPISFMASPAQAQPATFCNGAFVANSFYQEVQSNGATSTVSYRMHLQNRGSTTARYSVSFTAPNSRDAQNGSVVASLSSYQSVVLLLGRQYLHNPSGLGSLKPTEIGRYTQVLCPPAS